MPPEISGQRGLETQIIRPGRRRVSRETPPPDAADAPSAHTLDEEAWYKNAEPSSPEDPATIAKRQKISELKSARDQRIKNETGTYGGHEGAFRRSQENARANQEKEQAAAQAKKAREEVRIREEREQRNKARQAVDRAAEKEIALHEEYALVPSNQHFSEIFTNLSAAFAKASDDDERTQLQALFSKRYEQVRRKREELSQQLEKAAPPKSLFGRVKGAIFGDPNKEIRSQLLAERDRYKKLQMSAETELPFMNLTDNRRR